MGRRRRGSIPDQLEWEGRLIEEAMATELRGDPVRCDHLAAARLWLECVDRASDDRWRAFCLASYEWCVFVAVEL